MKLLFSVIASAFIVAVINGEAQAIQSKWKFIDVTSSSPQRF
jgi:hypothetical protein